MAQLTWRPIEAQQGSTRDIALAGQTIGTSFDRMAQLLVDRETRLRKEATDASLTGVLLANDEAGVDAATATALATGNPRIDKRVIAELAAAQKTAVLSREGLRQTNTIGKENILDRQGATAVAGMAPRWLELLGSGDPNQVAEANAEIEGIAGQDPVASRGIRQLLTEMRDSREFGVTEGRMLQGQNQDHSRGLSQLANDSRRVALAETEAAEARERRTDADEGFFMATQFAAAGRLQDAPTAKAKLYENPEFLALMENEPTKARAILENFDAAHTALTTETGDVKAGFKTVDQAVAAQNTALKASANRAENSADDPSLSALRRTGKYKDTLTIDGLADVVAKRTGPLQSKGAARSGIQEILDRVPGAELGDIQAAIDVYGYDPGAGKYVPGLDVLANDWEGDALQERVKMIVEQRKDGYTQNAELDKAAARQPFESKSAEMAELRTEMTRFARAQAAGTRLTAEQEERYRRAEARLVELASGKAK